MDVIYLAEPGPRLALGSVSITGLERLQEDSVLRRLGLRPGEPFSPTRLEAARRDLLAGGVLAWARLTPGDSPDAQGRLPLTLEVAERPPRVLRFAGAWSSDEGGTLSSSWTHRNLFGRAERLTLSGEIGRLVDQGPHDLSYLANATLRIPDLWRRDLNLRLDLGAVSESLEAYDREAATGGLALELRLSELVSGSAGVAVERSRITQDGLPQDYWLLSLPMTLTYDSTDEPLDPRRGLRLAALLTPAQELDADGQGFVLGRLTGSAYWDLGAALRPEAGPGRSVLAGRLVLGSIVGAAPDAVPPDWRFYAGGGGSVRGYPFQSIGPHTASGTPAGGDGLLEAGLELRQRFGANWGAVAFADAGAVSESGIPGTGALSVGVGIGLRYFTPIGPIRADIATPLNHNQGDPSVQLYIGIGQAF
jgi:translocation and assembly module TamA